MLHIVMVDHRFREECVGLSGAHVHPQHAAVRHIVEAPLYEATLHDAILHLPVVHAHAEVAFEDVDAAIVPSVGTALSKKKRMGPLRRLVVRRDARLSIPNEPPLKIILAEQTHSPRGVVLVKEGQQWLIHGLDPRWNPAFAATCIGTWLCGSNDAASPSVAVRGASSHHARRPR